MSSHNSTTPDFGANEWMVEEMRDAWLKDPTSVSPQWRSLFESGRLPGPSSQPAPAQPATKVPQPDAPSPAPAATPSSPVPQPSQSPQAEDALPETGAGAAPHRQASPAQDVTRSDLPPAPTSDAAPPTSPYAHQRALLRALDLAGQVREEDAEVRMKGAAARTAKNMEESLSIPTATSARAVPAKVLIENRAIINQHLSRTRGGKVSFTHLIGWAVVEAMAEMPGMNVSYSVDGAGKPVLREPAHVGFGLAVDVPAANGERRLLVPSIKRADELDLAGFVAAYEALVRKARDGKLEVEDFRGTTVTLTNPGMIGTLHSVPGSCPGRARSSAWAR